MVTQSYPEAVPESSGAGLELRNVCKRYGSAVAVDNVSLQIRPGELCCLLGPSGCGKSTTLRLIAGLEFPSHGEVLIGGKDMQATPPQKRDVGMVFQNYALFPHMNVFDNIAYGMACRGASRSDIHRQVEQALTMVQLSDYASRRINDLSGGEQQRVALARSLVTNPRLLLLDEPFSNLDARLREAMRDELSELQQLLGITTILVTHDQEEAMTLANNIALMRAGRIEQFGSPGELYTSPSSSFVANFLGRTNLFTADSFRQRFGSMMQSSFAGKAKYMAVRPESINIHSPGDGVPARIDGASFHGSYVRYRLSFSEGSAEKEEFTVERPADSSHLPVGDLVGITIHEQAVQPLAE